MLNPLVLESTMLSDGSLPNTPPVRLGPAREEIEGLQRHGVQSAGAQDH